MTGKKNTKLYGDDKALYRGYFIKSSGPCFCPHKWKTFFHGCQYFDRGELSN